MYICPVSNASATLLPSGLYAQMRSIDQASRKRHTLTRRTYIGTTERKPGAASRKGSSVLAKRREIGGMYEEVTRAAARSIRCGLRVQRYGPSYVLS